MKQTIRLLLFTIFIFSTTSFAGARSFNITFNNQAQDVQHVYLLLKGSIQGKPCFIRIKKLAHPNDQTISPCEPINASTQPINYAFDAINNVSFRVAPLSSARMYVSVNKPLIMHINKDGSVAEPSVYDSNPASNPDYKTLFDKVEFTYDTNGNTYFNPTAVDFISLPISITQHNNTFGLTTDRETAFASIQHTFNEELNSQEYQRLIIKDNNTLLRILAPGRESHSFNGNYLNPYIDWLFNDYYASKNGVPNHTLTLQLVEASGVVPGKPRILSENEGKFTGFVKGADFEFKNVLGDTIIINRSSFTSNSLFMAAMGNINVSISPTTQSRIAAGIKDPNQQKQAINNLSNGYKAVAVKFISSAWAVGLLPTPSGDVIDQNYIRQKIGTDVNHIYQQRAVLPTNLQNQGPWYQLYGKAIHLLTPHLYAFPYDDVLGLDGTNASNDSYPAVVTLHGMNHTATPAVK